MQRNGLFQEIAERFPIQSALYAGSYIHISPSYYFPKVVYVDSDKESKKFFADSNFHNIIKTNKIYSEDSIVVFHPQNYNDDLSEPIKSFDLLISQYAGFVSQACKKYLRAGGILLVNNSHGDAGVAYLDEDFSFIAAVNARSGKFNISTKSLGKYFVPKKSDFNHSFSNLLSLNRGIGYVKTAAHYIFQKNS